MAASGNEVVKLNQLKTYVKFASDEDAAAYFKFASASSNATGEEILTAAQLKNLIKPGGGSGTGGSWLTIMSGNWHNSSNSLLALTDVDNIDLDNYSKIAIECESTIYGTQSGRFEFNLPLPSVNDYHSAGNNEFELSGMSWSVGATDYGPYWVLCVRCVDDYFDSFMIITKVEVM